MKYPALIAASLLALCLHEPGANAAPQLDVNLSKRNITAKEHTVLTLRARWPQDEASYSFALPDLELQNLEVVRNGQTQETSKEGAQEWTVKTFTVELKPKTPGSAYIKGFTLPYIDPQLQKGGEFAVSAQELRIRRLPFWESPSWIAFISIFFVATATMAWGIPKYRGLRSSKRPPPLSAPFALEERLAAEIRSQGQTPAGQNHTQTILLKLSTSLRQYIASRYPIGSGNIGENELLRLLLKQEGLSREETEVLKSLLTQLHEAKFSGSALSQQGILRLQNDILSYLDGKKIIEHV